MYTNLFNFILILMFKHTTIFRDSVKWSFHNGKIIYHASGVILLWEQTIGVRSAHPLFTVQYNPFSMCPCYKTFLKGLNMKKQLTVMTLFHVLIFFFSISCSSKTENHVTPIVQNILYTKTAIEDYLKNRINQQSSLIKTRTKDTEKVIYSHFFHSLMAKAPEQDRPGGQAEGRDAAPAVHPCPGAGLPRWQGQHPACRRESPRCSRPP